MAWADGKIKTVNRVAKFVKWEDTTTKQEELCVKIKMIAALVLTSYRIKLLVLFVLQESIQIRTVNRVAKFVKWEDTMTKQEEFHVKNVRQEGTQDQGPIRAITAQQEDTKPILDSQIVTIVLMELFLILDGAIVKLVLKKMFSNFKTMDIAVITVLDGAKFQQLLIAK